MSTSNQHGKADNAHGLAETATDAIYRLNAMFEAIVRVVDEGSDESSLIKRLATIGLHYSEEWGSYFDCEREMLATEQQEVKS
jgi:hypothetical protein